MASGINLKKAQLAYNNVNKDIKNLETQLANFRKAVAEMNANIWYGGNSANKWYESANAAYKKDCKFLDSLYNIQSKLANKIDSTLAVSGSTEKTKKAGKGSGTGGGASVSGAAAGTASVASQKDTSSAPKKNLTDKIQSDIEEAIKELKDNNVPQENIDKVSSSWDDYKTGKISFEEYAKIYNKQIEGTDIKPLYELNKLNKEYFSKIKEEYNMSDEDNQKLSDAYVQRLSGIIDPSEYNKITDDICKKYLSPNLTNAQKIYLTRSTNSYINGTITRTQLNEVYREVGYNPDQHKTGNLSSQDQYAVQIAGENAKTEEEAIQARNKARETKTKYDAKKAISQKSGNLSSQDQYAEQIAVEKMYVNR